MGVMTTTVRAGEDGGGTMVIEWKGGADDVPIYMGTDEMLTLTLEETRVRDEILARLAPAPAAPVPPVPPVAPVPPTPAGTAASRPISGTMNLAILAVSLAVLAMAYFH